MSTRVANIISIIGIAGLATYVAWVYPAHPEPMPTHWNANGQPDDYTSKSVGAPILAAVPALVLLIFKIIPAISPHGFRTESFTGVLNILMTASVIFGCVISVAAIRAALGAEHNLSTIVMVSVGLLFMLIGNFLGKVRKNFFLGIRTPWTLASDEVWAKTHRLGGWCFVVAGAVMAIGSIAGPRLEWLVAFVVAIALLPVVYSYFTYRRIEGFGPDRPNDED
jgi:uncharacterized membrane protein